MAMVHEKMGNTPVVKKKKKKKKKTSSNNNNNNNNNSTPSSKTALKDYCTLCRKLYLQDEAQEHMHSMLHHRELEIVVGKNSYHQCYACKESIMGLNEYAQHISTAQHKARLKNLICRKVKIVSVQKSLSAETFKQIMKRNKSLKKLEKDQKGKKVKQPAPQKHPEVPQGVSKKHTVVSKVVKPDKSKQVNTSLLKQTWGTHQQGSSNAVFQSRENKVSSLQRTLQQRESAPQNQSGRFARMSGEPSGRVLHQPYVEAQFAQSAPQNQSGRFARMSGEPSGRVWHQPYVEAQFAQSAPQNQSGRFACMSGEPSGRVWHQPYVKAHFAQSAPQRYNHNFSFYNQCSDIPIRRPHNTQEGVTNVPEQKKWPASSQHDHYNKQYGSAADFTSDHLPHRGAIIFDHSQSKSTGSSESGQEGTAQPASASVAPIREADVSSMLRQIRRALGLREPCRADREARKQNSETGVQSVNQAGTEKVQPTGGSFINDAKEAAHHITSSSAATTPVQSSLVSSAAPPSHSGVHPSSSTSAEPNKTQGTDEHCESSSSFASDSNETPNNTETGSQVALDSPTSLSRFSGKTASSEPNLNIARRVRIAHVPSKGRKEAGLKPTVNKLLSLSGTKSKLSWREMNEEMRRKRQEKVKGMPRFGIELSKKSSAQAEDLPLTEGFHWESLPGSPLVDNWTEPPPPHQDTTDNGSQTETHSDSQIQEPPGQEPQDCSSETVAAVSLKVEPKDESGDLRDHSARKRKPEEEVTQEKETKEKKKKTKSNKDQNQMDQLLAVSLREDELSHSLQDLDQSLIQARNVLQATFTEVQRLLLVRQQYTAEVNSLRAKRIEILQGMQGGAAVQPNHSPLPSTSAFPTSSSQPVPPTNPASSISQPFPAPLALPIKPVKKETCQPPPVSCNPDTSQVIPLFPPSLLPPLLLTPPHLAAPTTVASLKQLCSASANPSPAESPARQQEQAARESLKDCVKTAMLAREEADSDPEEETGRNICPASEKPAASFVPERDQNGDDGGNESDSSVKMMEPSNPVIIDIDKSDNEETVSTVSVHQEPPQKSVSIELSSVSTQVLPQNDAERKVQPTQPLKNANDPPECVEAVDDEEPSLGAFSNHTGPVHGLQVHKGLLYTCSADNTARAYSLTSRECQAVFTGHTNKINCLLVSSIPNMSERLYTGSSDQTIRCHSIKSQKCLDQVSLSDRVLCLHAAWNILFAGLADGSVASFDLKTLKPVDVFECHGPRGVSCLGTAQEGARRVLLVGSYDSTISVRDAKSGLLLRSLEGHTKTVLCMKVVNDLVFSGSSDTSVHAHNIHTGELIRIYKGHSHAVTSIVILGKVMVTACLDKLVRVYELQSHDRMQVYGGHSDMVMCMAIHKSVIYTGCYDGSVQATKLNLMKNYRCWWHSCTLIFGLAEHLVQHLVKDHTNPNLQTVKCRWRSCSSFFATQHLIRQELPEHMRKHVEIDSEVQP